MDQELRLLYRKITQDNLDASLAMKLIQQFKKEREEKKMGLYGKTYIYEYNEEFLSDHTIHGIQVIPGVTHASLAVNTFFENFPSENGVHIHRLQFIQPIVVKKGQKVEVKVEFEKADDEYRFNVLFRLSPQSKWEVTAQGMISTLNVQTRKVDIKYLKEQMSYYDNISEIYNVNNIINLGKSYQTIKELYHSNSGVLSRVKLNGTGKDSKKYWLHPLFINSAFLAITPLFEKLKVSEHYLPFAMGDLTFSKYENLNECWLYIKKIKKAGEIIAFDAELINDQEEILATFTECSIKRISENGKDGLDTENQENLNLENENESKPFLSDKEQMIQQCSKYILKKIHSINGKYKNMKIDMYTNLMHCGIDSSELITLSNEMQTELGIEINPTLFFEYSSINEISTYLTCDYSKELSQRENVLIKEISEKQIPGDRQSFTPDDENCLVPKGDLKSKISVDASEVSPSKNNNKDIAVIGMHGLFPGCDDLDMFWDNISKGTDLISEIPLDHWDYRPWYDSDVEASDRTYCKWGSFINDVDKFDNKFFKISPEEAAWMDPQLRLLLQSIYCTAEDAGYIKQIRRSNTGLFVGVCSHDYSDRIKELNSTVSPFSGTGNSQTVIANRISFAFDLRGPSIAVDTACSSSLVALHLACQSLKNGECKMAFVAGANLLLSSSHYRYFSSIYALSSTGRCHTFDRKADGYVPGECIASLLLKPLSAAQKDGDHIEAVIKGSAFLHGGYTPSLTAPSVAGEENVIVKAWEDANIDPDSLTYIEAHGTGTKLGDPIEIRSLINAFKKYTKREEFCAIGSVKSNIGHTEGAAGIAGVIKTILQMKNKQIPYMPFFSNLNPYIKMDHSPLFINRKSIKWESPKGFPRRAGISSFGFSGAYAHVVLEEYKNPGISTKRIDEPAFNSVIIVLSAKNLEGLKNNALQLKRWLEKQDENSVNMIDVAYTLQLGRDEFEDRVAIVVSTKDDLQKKLSDFINDNVEIHGIYRGQVKLHKDSRIESKHEDVEKIITGENLKQNHYDKIIELWISGESLDWNVLYEGMKPRRISLPTYIFKKDRFWIPEKGTNIEKDKPGLKNAPEQKDHFTTGNEKIDTNNNDTSKLTKVEESIDKKRDKIIELLADLLSINKNSFDFDESFADFGLDSISAINFVKSINRDLNIKLKNSDLFDYSSINLLTDYIHQMVKEQPILKDTIHSIEHNKINIREPIAIIGMSGRFGKAKTTKELWTHIEKGDDLIEDITRWNLTEMKKYNLNGNISNKRVAALMTDIDQFDPGFFNISGIEAQYMDPQQRIFLQESYKALEDAGYAGDAIGTNKCGIYVGWAGSDYQHLFTESPPQALWGNMGSVIPARIAYYLDLRGPAVAIDTACSSSLVAIHLACQALWLGEIDMALAGGVSIQTTPAFYLAAQKAGMLSQTGRCYTFDSRADGFGLGEGVGVIVLKRLQKAIQDGDNIQGVINGIGVNQDGKTNGITAPSGASQERLERYVYDSFNINPRQVQMVEAHGTGTKLGDPIEIEALIKAFRHYTDKKAFCAIGSIKMNIGHTQIAAGIAGVIKILLSLRYKRIPPSLHFENENPDICFAESPFYVNTQLQDWNAGTDGTRSAAISSFGASGTNAHMVIGQAPESVAPIHRDSPAYLIVLSARSLQVLREMVNNLHQYCLSEKEIDLGNMSYTLLLGRKTFESRFACVVRNQEDLIKYLADWLENSINKEVYTSALYDKTNKENDIISNIDESVIEKIQKEQDPDQYVEMLEHLAKLFVQGEKMSFEELFSKEKYFRMSLPTYPFLNERYWVPSSNDNKNQTNNPIEISENDPDKSNISYNDEMQLLTFEEIWQESQIGKTSALKNRNIVCFLSDPLNQQRIRDYFKDKTSEVKITFISQIDIYGMKLDSNNKSNIQSRESFSRKMEHLRKQCGQIDVILYLWPLEDPKLIMNFTIIMHIIQSLASIQPHPHRVVLAGQIIKEIDYCYLNSWIGFERSLGLIFPHTQVFILMRKLKNTQKSELFNDWPAFILAELENEDGRSVLYENGKRLTLRILTTQVLENKSAFRNNGTYLITGGSGGLGFLLAQFLCKKYKANVIMTGRSEIDEKKQSKINALEHCGGKAIYIKADVCDRLAMEEGLRSAREIFGPVNAVIHAAGIHGTNNILMKDDEEYNRVLAAKVEGAFVLDHVLAAEKLDFILYFSSSAALLGDFGSCDYSVANRFLMGYAEYRNYVSRDLNRPEHTYVIHWPLWKEGGMNIGDHDSTSMYLKSSGQRFMETQEGISIMEKILCQDKTGHLVIVGIPGRVKCFLNIDGVGERVIHNDDLSGTITAKRTIIMRGFSVEQCIEWDLKEVISKLLKISKDRLLVDTNLSDFGFDSIMLADLSSLLTRHYGVDIPPAVFFGFSTIRKLVEHLYDRHKSIMCSVYKNTEMISSDTHIEQIAGDVSEKEKNDVEQKPSIITYGGTSHPDSIAIIGMSGRFPKARTIDEMWKILVEGRDVIEPFPVHRFTNTVHQVHWNPDRFKCGCIPGIEEFDPLFFEITPAEANIMDPRQRHLLQESWKALEDAGYGAEKIKNNVMGMFVGIEQGYYQLLLDGQGSITANHDAILAARLAYFLNFSGPVMAINTACSSGLVAVHSACQSLRNGECDTAIAGAVNFMLSPELLQGMEESGMLSKDGKCFAFDKRANGMVPGEAVVAVVLKKLWKAEKDGDPIYAVIKGSGINYDGKTNGMTAPNGVAQSNLLRSVYKNNNISVEDIDYIIAHGTGTLLGDPLEINALFDTFNEYTSKRNFCAITSTKTNFGHTFAASGLLSLTSMVMSLRHQTIPASLNCEQECDYFDWKNSPFFINKANRSWPIEKGRLRMGGVSAFGVSGTNAHVVIEEYPSEPISMSNHKSTRYQLLTISAKTNEALKEKVVQSIDFLEEKKLDYLELSGFCHTYLTGRHHYKYRLAIVASDTDEFLRNLKNFRNKEDFPGVIFGQVPPNFVGQRVLQAYMGELSKQIVKAYENDENCREMLLGIADLYCQGYIPKDTDFSLQSTTRSGLPTYPFAKERYWVSSDKAADSVPDDSKSTVNQKNEVIVDLIQPLWREKIPEQSNVEMSYERHIVVLCELDSKMIRLFKSQSKSVELLHFACGKRDIIQRYQLYTLQLLSYIQQLMNQKIQGKVLLQFVFQNHDESSLYFGFSGLLKTVQLEYPKFIGQVIAFDKNESKIELVNKILSNKNVPFDCRIMYRDKKRFVMTLEKVMENYDNSSPWKDNGVYLITGGGGKIGLQIAHEIVGTVKKPTIILTGRSVITQDKQNQLSTMNQSGSHVEYRVVDISDSTEMQKLITWMNKEFGELNGVFHCAGVIKDRYVLKKTEQEIKSVLAPKVAGLINLDNALKNSNIDFMALFSSGSSLAGNPGQADYAAANGFMDAFAHYRSRLVHSAKRKGHTISINWPLWRNGGMKIDKEMEDSLYERTAVVPLPTDKGMLALSQCIHSGLQQVIVKSGINKVLSEKKDIPLKAQNSLNNIEKQAINKDELMEAVLKELKQLLGETIKLDSAKIDNNEPLESYGIDSFVITTLNQKLGLHFKELSKTIFFEYHSLSELSLYLINNNTRECIDWTGANDKTKSKEAQLIDFHETLNETSLPILGSKRHEKMKNENSKIPEQEPIAIIGMSGHFPQARNWEQYWENLKLGINCIGEIPKDRWSLDDFFHSDMDQSASLGKSYCKWGGFIDGFSEFDPAFFNISPREAINIDPQERLFLQQCWNVLEDAGYTQKQLLTKSKQRVGVFAGITKTGFELYSAELWKQGIKIFPKTSFSSVANRVSYFLNLQGPSIPIDTMCSSSLTAIHEACEYLLRDDCEMAIAGGVNLYLHPSSYIGLCAQRMLSVDGKCKSFGKGSDGFVPGEGIGALLLKRLSKAEADGDNIHAIIRATNINHGGKTHGYTVPNPQAQSTLIRDTITKAGISPRAISFIEAHGTGTELGDPIEITGLTHAFESGTQDKQFCSIASVKSNIGHLEAASGIAAVIKVVLQMKYKKIVQSLHAKEINPNINFEKTPFFLQQSLTDWNNTFVEGPEGKTYFPRIAGISSFGAGGSNAHLILEEYNAKTSAASPVINITNTDPVIIVLSAKSEAQLQDRIQQLLKKIEMEQFSDVQLLDIAYTLQVGRQAMEERVGIVVESIVELKNYFKSLLQSNKQIKGVFRGSIKMIAEPSVSVSDNTTDNEEEYPLSKERCLEIVQDWVNGKECNWDRFYSNKKPQRISLPTYPFLRKQFWFSLSKEADRSIPKIASVWIHPMLHQNTSDFAEQRFSSKFTRNEFFCDLKMKGHYTLPQVVHLEMAVEAILQSISKDRVPEETIQLENVVWYEEDLVLKDSELHIGLVQNEDRIISFATYSNKEDKENCQKVYCQGSAQLLVPKISKRDLRKWESECQTLTYHSTAFYSDIANMGYEYGLSYQLIKNVYGNNDKAMAQLILPKDLLDSFDSYTLHPCMIESALIISSKYLTDYLGIAYQPVRSIEKIVINNKCQPVMWVVVEKRSEDDNIIDVDLCDENGFVGVQFLGVKISEKKSDDVNIELIKPASNIILTHNSDLINKPTNILLTPLSKNNKKEKVMPPVLHTEFTEKSVSNLDTNQSKKIEEEIKLQNVQEKMSLSHIENQLKVSLAKALFMTVEEIDPNRPFVDLGLDSIVGVEWIREVNNGFSVKIDVTKVYDYPTIIEFSEYVYNQINEYQSPVIHEDNKRTQNITLKRESEEKSDIQKEEKSQNNDTHHEVKQLDTPGIQLHDFIRISLADALYINADEIDPFKPFIDLGLDSIISVEWVKVLNKRLGLSIDVKNIYDYPTLNDFEGHIKKLQNESIIEVQI